MSGNILKKKDHDAPLPQASLPPLDKKRENLLSFLSDYMPQAGKHRAQSMKDNSRNRRRGREWQNRAAFLLVFLGLISGLATYGALSDTQNESNNPEIVIWLLNADLIILLVLVMLIASRLVGVWSGRKRGLAGSHLHVRLVYTFSVLAAAPAIIMTIFSAFFFHYGVQTWFSQRVQTAINESQAVASAYLEEHKQVIRADTLAMVNDLNRQASLLIGNPAAFEKIMQTQSVLRNLSEAIVFDSAGRVLARSGLTFSLEYEEVPSFALQQADEGEVVIMTGKQDDRVRALAKLGNFADSYLFVGRMVDPKVLNHLDQTREAVQDYAQLQERYSGLQVTVTMIFVVVGLLMVLGAIWFGLLLARQLVTPISTLITTADRVRAGDLTARVPEQDNLEEFDYLARSFNRMTSQIEEQQGELITANRQLDRRRRFTETVLAGVSSGVIGVNEKGAISLVNNSARLLLGSTEEKLNGKPLNAVIPELTGLIEAAHDKPHKITQGEIPVHRGKEGERIFLFRIAVELIAEEDKGMIITFDDITELQSAQRKAAWADVARRIAHEIKNPLTPIQLSAERLKRKYLGEIKSDPATFSQCTDTIIKHVEDIGRMVDEFSAFARMPEPVMKIDNLNKLAQDTIFLQKQAHPTIEFNLHEGGHDSLIARLDAQQIRQALTNLLQNAIDSVDMRIERDKKAHKRTKSGTVALTLGQNHLGEFFICVSDNGLGLPVNENPVHLTEPYVTHKAKGTGLGLAIVKKIMEDHDGELILEAPDWIKNMKGWHDLGGANIILLLPATDFESMAHG